MKRSRWLCARVRTAVAILAVAIAVTAAGCSGGDQADGGGQVTLKVGNLPSSERAEDRANFLRQADEFRQANPGVKLETVEWEWNKDTFNAQLAGGTLPDTFKVPYTEPRGLIARRQLADVTSEFTADPDLARINKGILAVVTDSAGKIYGVPTEGYTIALIYNRDLFRRAGLNPDSPPRSWDEVRQAAKAIAAAVPGAAGYSQMTLGGYGGWMFSAMLYAFGGTIEEPAGDGFKASFNSQAGRTALNWLKTARWADNAMGAKFVGLDQETLRKELAAGRVGMYLDGADSYQAVTTNFKLDPQQFGVTVLPQSNGTHGTLGGGSVSVMRRDLKPAERAAAMKWIKFTGLGRYFNQAQAQAQAKARAADGLPVGAPEFPLTDRTQLDTYLAWIKPYVNTPQANFAPYVSGTAALPVIPEPPARAQDVYNALANVVQAVLTRQDADIDKLLADAEGQVNKLLSSGN
jgi:multiple sugar transport system substrate-binding protein